MSSLRPLTAVVLDALILFAAAAAPAGATPFAYVSSGTDLVAIDTLTDTVAATIPVGESAGGILVNPDGSRVYMTGSAARLKVIDTATNAVTDGGQFSAGPVSLNPNGTRLYILDGTTVRVVDTATFTIVASIPIGGTGGFTMAMHPSGSHLYVPGGTWGFVAVVDTTTNTVSATITLSGTITELAISPGGAKLYVAGDTGTPIYDVDTATNTVTTTISIPQGSSGLAVNPAGTRLYVPQRGSIGMHVVDTATDSVITTVPLAGGCLGGAPARDIAVNPAGTKAYFRDTNNGCVGVLDTASNTIINSLPITAPSGGYSGSGLFIGPFCPGACSDGNPCTTDSCDPIGGCGYTFNTGPCASDGNQCTDDVCDSTGNCTHPNSTAGTTCTDGLFCDGADTCDGAGGCNNHAGDPCAGGPECAHTCNEAADNCLDPATTSCTSDGNVCTDDHCGGGGTCVHTANTASCDDGLFCDGADTCAGTVCTHAGDPCASGPECANQCNEGAHDCLEPAGTACTSDSNQCTFDQCNGTGACAHPARPDGTPCDDANACTSGDQCSGGVCAGPTTIVCDPCETCTPAGGCELPTAPGCLAAIPGGSSILLRDGGPIPDKDLLNWKWKSSGSVALSDFGDPTTTTDLTVCVIDQAGLRLSATAPAGGTCGTKPCWSVVPMTKLKYSDKELTPDGLQKLQVKPGGANVAKIATKGKGTNLAVSGLGLSAPVTVRLVRSGGPACWEATYGSHVLLNKSSMFKAKSD